jgi:deoxyribodipyrimidine photo-lyase
MKVNLLIFQNDLRLHDNQAFYEACKNSDELLVIYILDNKLFEITKWGFLRASESRLFFLYKSLEDLEQSFSEKNAHFNILKSNWQEVLNDIKNKYEVENIFLNNEISSEERNNIELTKKIFPNSAIKIFRDNSLIQFSNLGIDTSQFPNSFSGFRKLVENDITRIKDKPDIQQYEIPSSIKLNENYTQNINSLLQNLNYEPDPRTAFPFNGGESNGVARLHYYLEESKCIENYKETRNNLLGNDYSSKLSPWLANGSLSIRYAYQAIENYEKQIKQNQSTYWLKFELLWREFFRHLYMRHKEKFFHSNGINNLETDYNNKFLDEWISANTGNDFIDANMKELNSTGFMSNRGRQNVASYLIHNLQADWRAGASYFESKLIDYDVYSNWGNWQYIAGLGGTNEKHVFDIDFQRKKYDSHNLYVKQWSG